MHPPLDAAVPDRPDSAPPFLMGFRGAEPEAGLLDTETLFAQVGFNIGNLTFCHTILGQLKAVAPPSRQPDDSHR